MKANYSEGTWFAVPLRSGGFGTGLIAKATRDGGVILAYLFGPRRETVPALTEVAVLQPSAAVKVARIGDLNIINGKWPIIGRTPEWQPSSWVMPRFVRSDELGRRAWSVQYSDDDPNLVSSEDPVPFGTSGLERDSVLGAGAAEIVLTKLLVS
jgi:hypothetical protein